MLATFDAYYPGYIDYMPVYQNIPSWWTETQGGGLRDDAHVDARRSADATTRTCARRRSI